MSGYGYGWQQQQGWQQQGWQQGCDYGSPGYGGNNSGTFVLIVVLFILLIIVGSAII